MTEGFYPSRGEAAAQIAADRAEHDALMASQINVPISVKGATEGGAAVLEVFELLEDVGRGLDFVHITLLRDGSAGEDPGIQGILSVMAMCIRLKTESADFPVRQLGKAAMKAGADAQLEAMK